MLCCFSCFDCFDSVQTGYTHEHNHSVSHSCVLTKSVSFCVYFVSLCLCISQNNHRVQASDPSFFSLLSALAHFCFFSFCLCMQCQVFDKRNGAFVRKFGSEGEGNGQFRYPNGVAVDGRNIFVCDTGNNRIVQFFN